MTDMERVGKRIASLRRERGFTGEGLAERLNVSPQAVSKWENARCLPETAILPELAQALACSIDSLLLPRELFILEAVYTDGQTHIPVTRFVDDMVRGNRLNIYVNAQFVGEFPESDRLRLLTVKFQTPEGIFYSCAAQNENLTLDQESGRLTGDNGGAAESFRIIGAWYGNEKSFVSVMGKLEHYAYFKWDGIPVNHETFPSNPASDDTEYLTVVYLNREGIHAISCPENRTLYYGKNRTWLQLRDQSKCILKGIDRLSWGQGRDCPWAGALCAALEYMGEKYAYHQIMGMSGACYRVCFTDVWDYSCTDALVSFDFVTPLERAIGFSLRMVERLEKEGRRAERLAIMEDIRNGRPVLAINLRVAPEWGVITGYTEDGGRFLCRTYFDQEIFDELEREECQDQKGKREVFEENEGYLYSDFWPFLITHFGERSPGPEPMEILKASLGALVSSFQAEESRGYHQGKEAYEAWMDALSRECSFDLDNDRENALRRLDVNDSMLCQLVDARKAAERWLTENLPLVEGRRREELARMAQNCRAICDTISAFQDRVQSLSSCGIVSDTVRVRGVSTEELHREQIAVLEKALALDEESCHLAQSILSEQDEGAV